MVEIVFDTYTIIGLFISIGGLIAVVLYNALKIKQNTKSQYYQVLKDLDKRFHDIQNIDSDGTRYLMNVHNFGHFIKELIDAKIVPKKLVLQPYKILLGETFWIIQHLHLFEQEKDAISFVKFCQDNHIEEKSPPKWTLK